MFLLFFLIFFHNIYKKLSLFNKMKLRKNWPLGFLGFLSFLAILGIKEEYYVNYLWLVWIVWFINFIPVKNNNKK